MVEFSTDEKSYGERAICEIYAIRGKDGCGKEVLLAIGKTDDGIEVPVMDLSSAIHYTYFPPSSTKIREVCEDMGIIPESAICFDDYRSFSLTFNSNAKRIEKSEN